MANGRGRPPKFETPEAMQEAVDEYFALLDGAPPTISGLAYHLGMTTQALRGYEQKDNFLSIVKMAKQRVEMALEQNLYSGAPTGSIFSLKCNFRWREKDEEKQRDDKLEITVKRLGND
jgi:hypothetical protein